MSASTETVSPLSVHQATAPHRRTRQIARIQLTSVVFGLAMLLVSSRAAAQGSCDTYPVPGGIKTFGRLSAGTVVRVNFNTFEAQGISASNKEHFLRTVQESISRWKEVSGAAFSVTYDGTTTSTVGSGAVVVVKMAAKSLSSIRLAETDYQDNTITFFRRYSTDQNIPWQFADFPLDPDDGSSFDAQAVFMHEFGHVLGLNAHSDAAGRPTMGATCEGYYHWVDKRFGPNSDDISRLRSVNGYGVASATRIKTRLSTTSGASWSSQSNAKTTDGAVSSTIEPGGLRDGSTYVLTYRALDRQPRYIVASNADFSTVVRSGTPAANLTSVYGVDIGGESNEWMLAFVDPAGDNMQVRVFYTSNAGLSWFERTFNPTWCGGVRAAGTPSIIKTSSNTWYIAFPLLDITCPELTGSVLIARSTDDGNSWINVSSSYDTNYYSTQAAVSIVNTPGVAEIRSAFSWDNAASATSRFQVRSDRWQLDLTNILSVPSSSIQTYSKTALGRNSSGSIFLAARERATNTLQTAAATPGPNNWGSAVSAGVTTPTGVAFAADKDSSNVYIYYWE